MPIMGSDIDIIVVHAALVTTVYYGMPLGHNVKFGFHVNTSTQIKC